MSDRTGCGLSSTGSIVPAHSAPDTSSLEAASISPPNAADLLKDALQYRALNRYQDTLHLASKAASEARAAGNVLLYCSAVTVVAESWRNLGEPKSGLLVLEAGWREAEPYLDRMVADPQPMKQLLEALAVAHAACGNEKESARCFADAKLLFGGISAARAAACVDLGVRQLVGGDLVKAAESFSAYYSEAVEGAGASVRTAALANVGRGILLWLEGYEDGMLHIANGMNHAKLEPAVERECRAFAREVSQALLQSAESLRYHELFEEILHAVS